MPAASQCCVEGPNNRENEDEKLHQSAYERALDIDRESTRQITMNKSSSPTWRVNLTRAMILKTTTAQERDHSIHVRVRILKALFWSPPLGALVLDMVLDLLLWAEWKKIMERRDNYHRKSPTLPPRISVLLRWYAISLRSTSNDPTQLFPLDRGIIWPIYAVPHLRIRVRDRAT